MSNHPVSQTAPDPLLSQARKVATVAREHGGRALLVGGYVRDQLLGLAPKDADLEVYGIEAEPLLALLRRLGRVDCVGESFRVYKLVWHRRGSGTGERQRYELDVSLPRRDQKVGTGHRGFLVEGDPHATIEEAARRRDFTINAMLRDPLSGELIDPFHGHRDLQDQVLRVVDRDHFAEDSLRVLRAVQFAARFEMTIEPATVELCRGIALSDLPRERIWGEWEKMLLKPRCPSLGLRAAHELGVLAQLFPRLDSAVREHGERVGWVLDAAAAEKDGLAYAAQVTLLMAALCVCLHRDGAVDVLDALGLKTLTGYDVRAQCLALIDNAAVPAEFFERRGQVTDGELRRVALRCDPRLLCRLARARGEAPAAAWFIERMRELGAETGPPPPLLMGRHLLDFGVEPGPCMGELTRAVYELQLDGAVTTLEQAVAAARDLIEPATGG